MAVSQVCHREELQRRAEHEQGQSSRLDWVSFLLLRVTRRLSADEPLMRRYLDTWESFLHVFDELEADKILPKAHNG